MVKIGSGLFDQLDARGAACFDHRSLAAKDLIERSGNDRETLGCTQTAEHLPLHVRRRIFEVGGTCWNRTELHLIGKAAA